MIRLFLPAGGRARHYGERGTKSVMPTSALGLVGEVELFDRGHRLKVGPPHPADYLMGIENRPNPGPTC